MRGLIVFKIPEFPHVSETFIVAQLVTAISFGYDVKILTRRLIEIEKSNLSPNLLQYELLDKIIIEDYEIPKNKVFRLVKWFFLLIRNFKDISFICKFYKQFTLFSLAHLYQLNFYKQFNKASIIHVQYGTNKTPLDILKKICFLKPSLIVTFHGHDAFFPINGYIPNHAYYNDLFQYGDLITANTLYLGNEILKLGCPRKLLELIPVAVDTTFFYPISKNEIVSSTFRLVMVGRLSPVKGHIICLKVIKLLINEGYKVNLKIVGEGNERANLEQFISFNNLEEHVELVGAKTQNDIRDLFWNSDLFLFSSVSLKNGRAETQGLAIIEAAACGLATVAFDSGGVKYTIKDKITGYLCKENDIICMTSKIKYLIGHPDKLKEMGEKAIEFVNDKYSNDIVNKKWETIYHKLDHNVE